MTTSTNWTRSSTRIRTLLAGTVVALVLGLAATGPAAVADGGYSNAGKDNAADGSWLSCTTSGAGDTCTYTSLYVLDAMNRNSDTDRLREQTLCFDSFAITFPAPVEPLTPQEVSINGGGNLDSTHEWGCAALSGGALRIDGISSASLRPATVTLEKTVCQGGLCEAAGSRNVTIAATWKGSGAASGGYPFHRNYRIGECLHTLHGTGEFRSATLHATLDGVRLAGSEDSGAELFAGTYMERMTCH